MKIFQKLLSFTVLAVGVAVAANFAHVDAASAACVDNTYRIGNSGTCVKYAQRLVNYYVPSSYKLTADGIFGSRTQKAVTKVQSSWHKSKTGTVNASTWHLICTFQGGGVDSNGRTYMGIFSKTWYGYAKSAGCSKYWHQTYVGGVWYK
jgi:hypothetical protein